jgi:hypothetical protein
MIKKIMLVGTVTLLAAVNAAATAQAAPPKWYVGNAPTVVTGTTGVVLTGKLVFHYRNDEQDKFTTKCLATGEGTISNSGPEGLGVDEVTSMTLSNCVNNKSICVNKEVQQEFSFFSFYFPWGSRLAASSPVRDELNVPGPEGYCTPPGAHAVSGAGLVTPLVKGSALKFDNGHNGLGVNKSVTGSLKVRTVSGEKVAAF